MAEPRASFDQRASADLPFIVQTMGSEKFAALADDKKLYFGSDGDSWLMYDSAAGALEFGGAPLSFEQGIEIPDDELLALGTDSDQVLVNRSTSLTANTALASVIIGTPVTSAVAANSLILSNTTASGDILVIANRGGNSEEYIFVDASAGTLTLTAPLGNLDLKGSQYDKPVRIKSQTFTGTLTNSIIGFQSKPGAGANAAGSVIGCEISPRISDTFTGTTIIGAHVDAYLKGTTGNLSGDVRALNLELVTDDAGTRTITGDVVGLRMRAAFSGTISGNMTAFKVEKAEAQTNSKQWEYLFELTGDNALVWREDYTTEVSTAGSVAGAIKVRVNGADRWIALYDTAPTV